MLNALYDEHTRQDLEKIVSNVIKNLPDDKSINIKTQFISNPIKKLDFTSPDRSNQKISNSPAGWNNYQNQQVEATHFYSRCENFNFYFVRSIN